MPDTTTTTPSPVAAPVIPEFNLSQYNVTPGVYSPPREITTGIDERFLTGRDELLGPDYERIGRTIDRPDFPAGTEFTYQGKVYTVSDTGHGTRKINYKGTVSDLAAQDVAGQNQRMSGLQNQLLTDFRGVEQGLLDQFSAAIAGQEPVKAIYERLGQEVGLPGLKTTAQNLTEMVENIPTSVKNLASQFAISAPRQEQRMQVLASDLTPRQQKAVTQFQNALSEVSTLLGFELQDQEKQLMPFAQAFSIMSDRIAREMTGFTNQMQNTLNVLLTQLQNQGNLAVEQLRSATSLAEKEADYLHEKDMLQYSNSIVEANGRKLLVNTVTGDIIADLGSSSSGSGGGGGGFTFGSEPPGQPYGQGNTSFGFANQNTPVMGYDPNTGTYTYTGDDELYNMGQSFFSP